MKKIGSLQFFEDVDLHLKFDFGYLMTYFKADDLGIKQNLLDENQNFKMDKLTCDKNNFKINKLN